MILSDKDIAKAMEAGQITISPPPAHIDPCSVDLRLGSTFRVFDPNYHACIDTRRPLDPTEYTHTIRRDDDQPFILQPRDFVIAVTFEEIRIGSDLMGILDGRSSLARLGIIVHSTAGRIDPGFDGAIVLELGNVGRMPVALYPGIRICAVRFERLSSTVRTNYTQRESSKYRDQHGPTGSKMEKR